MCYQELTVFVLGMFGHVLPRVNCICFRYVWSTKVKDVLGQDYEFVDSYRTEELTFKDLLSHRTGLARLDSGLMSGNPRSITRSQLCK